ncbi:MAG: endonuclease III domain-containing protein [Candidatus Micrarchaeota archaeon]|nr:endonuclease III domain-containing protein [Candidatus Micrarchaeota archaeon]
MGQLSIYKKLLKHFGKQYWWPAESEFEVIVGAMLTQQSTWRNVEKAIVNLKRERLLTPKAIAQASVPELQKCVRPTGFYRQKARRLRDFARYLERKYNGKLELLFSKPVKDTRDELLSLDGIGPETADSILLYAGGKLIFPIDAYTKRVYERLGLAEGHYSELQKFFHYNLPRDLVVYKEMHALIVELAKDYCSKNKPLCGECPLREQCSFERRFINM